MYKKQVRSIVAVLCCLLLLLSSFVGTAVADTQSVVDAIGLVSYRASVLTAIEAAEAVYDTLTDEQKAAVDAARTEYDRLGIQVRDIQKVINIDLTAEGWGYDGSTREMTDSTDAARPGQHMVLTTTGNWSIWYDPQVSISDYDFNNLFLGMDIKRTGGDDSNIQFDIKNASQAMCGSKWYGEYGGVTGEWGFFTQEFTTTENSADWSKWTAEAWDSEAIINQIAFRQTFNPATTIEIASMGIYDKSIDNVTPVNQANAVIDQIAVIASSSEVDAINAARAAYNALSDTAKALVTNEAALSALESNMATASDVVEAIDAIGLVSYRASVLAAIENAEKLYSALDAASKAEVTNAADLTTAREEYGRLADIAQKLTIVWEADTSVLEGVSYDGSELTVEDMGDTDEHAGEHWVITTTGDSWSVWGNMELDISEYDFDKLKFGFGVRRTNVDEEADGWFEFDLRNGDDQRLVKSRWYAECGAANGEWTYMEFYFNEFEDAMSGQNPWPNWTADTWNSDSPMIMFRFAQNAQPADTIEVDRVAIYYEGADIQALVDEANEVVDQIAAIGEVTSAEQEDAVEAAREAYDSLTAAQQELVVNGDVLQTMEVAVRQYKTAANVVTAIENIGEVTAENYAEKADSIASAREAYDTYYNKYNDETLITNLATLTAAEEAYNGFVAAQKAKDIAALKELIAAIGEVTKDNSAEALPKIEAAEAARDALAEKYGDEVLTQVDTLETLTAARETYDALTAYTLGDVNDDGNIDASDALLALQHSVQLTTLEDGKFAAADTNQNGTVDATDALLILQYSVKLITEFPKA